MKNPPAVSQGWVARSARWAGYCLPSAPVRVSGAGSGAQFAQLAGRYALTVLSDTPHSLAISLDDSPGNSRMAISTQRRLSAFVRLNPCAASAPALLPGSKANLPPRISGRIAGVWPGCCVAAAGGVRILSTVARGLGACPAASAAPDSGQRFRCHLSAFNTASISLAFMVMISPQPG